MSEQLYIARQDSEQRWYVHGPGDRCGEMGFHGGTLSPGSRFDHQEDADRAAMLCQLAYDAGVKNAQADMRKSLGL